MNNLSRLIFLEFDEKGESKTGIINIHFTYNCEEHVINYQGMELSDHYLRILLNDKLWILDKILDKI